MASHTARHALKRRAVYAGSFDPVTNGHLYVISEGARLFDQLIVAVGDNPSKKYSFSVSERMALLGVCVMGYRNVRFERFDGQYLVDFANAHSADYVIKGMRNSSDFEYERTMRQINGDLAPNITTLFVIPPRELCEISSSFVKGLVGPKGWERVVKRYLPAPVYSDFLRRFKNKL